MIFAELDSRPDKGGGRGGKGIRAKDEKKFLQDFLQEHVDSGSFPNITVLICYLLLIPCSSVCCERGFSLQNLIKTALRARLDANREDLEPYTLNQLMRIYLNADLLSPADYYTIARKWIKFVKADGTKKKRRMSNLHRYRDV